MGQLGLSTNGMIHLSASSLVVRFTDSSPLNWDANSLLVITGWSGSYSGNGSSQVYFGTSSSGLTPAELSQVRFLDPMGNPPGYYDARILSTGEVVPGAPAPAPTLQVMRSGNQLVLTWSGGYQLFSSTNVLGPYSPVYGSASPYTNETSGFSQRFFLLELP